MLVMVNGRSDQELAESITKNIRTAINTAGKGKSEIARAIGVAAPTISQYLSGRIQPTLVTLVKLCEYLGISADDILT